MRRSIEFGLVLILLLFGITGALCDVRVAVLGDRTGEADQDVFAGIVNEIAMLDPDVVVNVGDLIEGPQPDEDSINMEWDVVLNTLSRLSMPVYFVPGNNDIFDQKSRDLFTVRTRAVPYYSFDCKPAHFIVLDNSQIEKVEDFSDEQLNWLENDLKEHKNAPLKIVIMHKPFWYTAFEKNQTDVLHDMFKTYNVNWVFSGHYHSYASADRDGIHYVMIGSSGGHTGDNPARGEFYQYGWLTIHDKTADFCLLKAKSAQPRENLTIEQRVIQDKIEDEYIDVRPIVLEDNQRDNGTFSIKMKNLWGKFSAGNFAWNTDDTPWSINPVSGRYSLPEKGRRIDFSADIRSDSIYPLPVLKLDCPLEDDGIYPTTRKPVVVREITIHRFAHAPEMNGLLDDACWKKSTVIRDFGNESGGDSDIELSEVRLVTDRKRLYIGVKAIESEPDAMFIPESKRDGPIFQGDCMYFMFWTDEQKSQIIQAIISPAGVISDRKGPVPADDNESPNLDKAWDGEFQIATATTSIGWNLEISIPLADLGITKVSSKSILRFNVLRYQARFKKLATWHWPPTYSSKNAGVLHFR
jgi:predicted phosphodiesterase